MSNDPAPDVIGELDPVELRVIGCLVEKQAVTPDVYPMTTNALVTAANQKTSREPVSDYNAAAIDGALLRLRQRGLIRMVHQQGSRATKHRHVLDEALGLGQDELALLAVLMLRGAQTPGELRSRTERIWSFDDVSDVEAVLSGLAGRGYVVEHERVPGQSARRWSQLWCADPISDAAPAVSAFAPAVSEAATFSDAAPAGSDAAADFDAAPARSDAAVAAAPPAPVGSGSGSSDSRDDEIAALRSELATLVGRFNELCARLGESDI